MDWQPSIVYGDGGFIGPPSYFGRSGAFPQSIRFQWMLELARGLVGNSLFVYIPWLPWLLTESAAELGLATYEFVPFMFAPVGVAQPVLHYTLPALEAPADYLSRMPALVTKAWRDQDGAIMLLLINLRDQPYQLDVSVVVPGAPVLEDCDGSMPLENHRAVPLKDGTFSATLSPFDVQAFVFNITKPAEKERSSGAVINGGMESYVLPGHAVGWTIAGNALSRSGNVSAFVFSETRFAHSGYHSLRFTTPFDTFAQTRLPLPLNGSEVHSGTYTVTAWTRIYDARAPRSLHLVNGDAILATVPLTREWTKLEAQVQLSSSQESELALMAGGPGTLYVDDVSCVANSRRDERQRAAKPVEATVNTHTRAAACTRHTNESSLSADGAPFIPTGFVMQDLVVHGTNHSWFHLRRLSSRGINLLLLHEVGLQLHGGVDVQLQLAALDVAFACGQKVVARLQAPPGASSVWIDSVLKTRVQKLKDHPALLGWWLGSELSAADQASLYHSVKNMDASSEHYVFAAPPADGSSSDACSFDVRLLTVDHRRVREIKPPADALTLAVVGHDPMLTASESRVARPLFHTAAAKSSELSLAVYGSMLRGCIGAVYGGWHPGTPYSLENGMGEMALQLTEMLPAFAPPTLTAPASSPQVSGPSGVLVGTYTEGDGTLYVVAANTQPQPVVAASIECSGWSLDTPVSTPFSTNNSLTLQASDGKPTLTRLLQPFEVQIFRTSYSSPPALQNCIASATKLLASNCTLVEDPAFESLQLFYGRPTLWKMNVYVSAALGVFFRKSQEAAAPQDVMLFGGAVQEDASCGQLGDDTVCHYPGFYSSVLVERRPGFVLPGKKHSLRVTRPYPAGDGGELVREKTLSRLCVVSLANPKSITIAGHDGEPFGPAARQRRRAARPLEHQRHSSRAAERWPHASAAEQRIAHYQADRRQERHRSIRRFVDVDAHRHQPHVQLHDDLQGGSVRRGRVPLVHVARADLAWRRFGLPAQRLACSTLVLRMFCVPMFCAEEEQTCSPFRCGSQRRLSLLPRPGRFRPDGRRLPRRPLHPLVRKHLRRLEHVPLLRREVWMLEIVELRVARARAPLHIKLHVLHKLLRQRCVQMRQHCVRPVLYSQPSCGRPSRPRAPCYASAAPRRRRSPRPAAPADGSGCPPASRTPPPPPAPPQG